MRSHLFLVDYDYKNRTHIRAILGFASRRNSHELVDGQAIPKVSPKYFHSSLQEAFLVLIRTWCKGKGRVKPEWAITLKCEGKDWVPTPGLIYISYDRLPKNWKQNEACPVPPELAIEIISPGQTMQYFEDKAQDYLANGRPLA